MANNLLIQVTVGLALLALGCNSSPLRVSPAAGVSGGSGGSGGPLAGSSGGSIGFIIPIPDGGLSLLFGDGGLLAGILDAPRDSVLGQVICGPEVRLGVACSAADPGCLLPSLGGVCACVGGSYLCPLSTGGPTPCPAGAGTGKTCVSPLSTCIGGSANGCICGLGTYTCF